MHSSSDNIKLISYSKVNDVIEKHFKSLCSGCQDGLETSMNEIDFIFDSARLMYYKCEKVDFKRGGSYLDFLNWIKKKRATVNPKHGHDKCFQYAATVILNYEEIN